MRILENVKLAEDLGFELNDSFREMSEEYESILNYVIACKKSGEKFTKDQLMIMFLAADLYAQIRNVKKE